MEEGKEEVKKEIKKDYDLSLIESGVDIENIITTIKKEDGDIIHALVNVTKEENLSLKFDADSKLNISSSLVSSYSGLDVKKDECDTKKISFLQEKTKAENCKGKLLSCVAKISNKDDSEKIIEDVCPDNYESGGTEGDFGDLSSLQNIPENPSIPVGTKKKYIKERKYTCKYCGKSFPQTDILRRHIRTHTGEKPYECSFCYKRFISKSLMNRHNVIHTGKTFGCSFCDKRFFQSQGLKTHLLIHEGKKPFKCAQCHMAFRAKSIIIRHIRRVHMKSQNKQERQFDEIGVNSSRILASDRSILDVKTSGLNNNYECNDCGKTYTSKDGIVEHMKNAHIQEQNYQCNDCGKTFTNRDRIVEHMRNVHIQEQKYQYCCRVCGYSSSKKGNWKKHLQRHENVYPFKCKLCDMRFKQKLGLNSHHKQVHETEKPFKCADCDSSFKMKANLVSHMQIHHSIMEKEFSCDICNMKFKRKCYLQRHVQTHTGADKKHICNECGLRCRSKTDIAKHVLTHFGAVEKSFTCEVCGVGFSKRSHLVRHRRVHSDQKIFTCELCDKAYKDPTSLKTHRESIHFGANFSCQVCGFKSTNRHSFNRHLRKCQR